MIAVPADQAWFWTDRWQRMEREVDEHVGRGEVASHDSAEELFADLDRSYGSCATRRRPRSRPTIAG